MKRTEIESMIKKAIEYIKHESPSIVEFPDGQYGIRKKESYTSSYRFLDIQDFNNGRTINWRVSMHLSDVYSWCTHPVFDTVYNAHKQLCEKQKNL